MKAALDRQARYGTVATERSPYVSPVSYYSGVDEQCLRSSELRFRSM